MPTQVPGTTRAFRVVILTGSESPATIDSVRGIADTPGVEIAAVMFDRGVLSLTLRLRRLWKRAKAEGVVTYLPLRVLGRCAELTRRIAPIRFDPKPIRRAIFPDEIQTVEEFCLKRSLRYIRVDSLNNPDAQTKLAALGADLAVVIGTRILKAATFTIPRLGSINLHKGQVPRYRGMPPAFWELYYGEKEAGVTVHFVIEKLDAGPILREGTVAIGPHETEHSLGLKLDELGTRLLRDAVEGLAKGSAAPRGQPLANSRTHTAPTRRQRATLKRRLGTWSEPTPKRLLKRLMYTFLLFGGPTAVRNLWLRLRRKTRYTVLLYHRVNDFSKDRLTTSVDRFIHHLAILKRRYPVVSLGEALEAGKTARFLGPNVVILTFDDGYADNAQLAAPILKHFNLSATFFVTAGLVGTERGFAHDGTSPYSFSTLTWDQVRSLQADGFEVGSHGWSHLNLTRCPLDEARREIAQSRELLTRAFEAPVRSFAYPYGGREDISPAVVREIVGAGFEAVASAYGGTNVASVDPHNVLRIAVNDTSDGLTLRALVEGVALTALREAATRWLNHLHHTLGRPRPRSKNGLAC